MDTRATNGIVGPGAQRDSGLGATGLPDSDSSHAGLVQIVWHRRRILAAVVAASLLAGLIYLLQATPIFTSTSRLYVEQKGPRIITEAEGVMTESKNYLFTQSELMKSMPILSNALELQDLARMRTLAEADNKVGFLKQEMMVSVGKKDDIISVSLDSPWPEEAAQIVNAVVDSYVTYHMTKKRSTASEVLKILQKEKSKRDAELAEKLQGMLDFQRENGAMSFESDKSNIVLQRLARLSDALTDAQLQLIEAEAACQMVAAAKNDPVRLRQLLEVRGARDGLPSPGAEQSRLQAELSRCRLRLAELQREFTADAPTIKSVRAQVEELQKELAEWKVQAAGEDSLLAEAQVAAVQERKRAAEMKEEQIRQSFGEQQKLAEQFNVKAAKYALLRSELERSERLCDILNARIKELNVTEDAGPLNITILEVAKPEDKPTKPHKARVMGASLVLGLILGVGFSLLRDRMDQRLRSANEISTTLGLPVLGVVPHIGEKSTLPSERGQRVRRDPQSSAAEAYRTVRTAVYFGVPGGQPKTILVTSPSPGDGKTTLTSNLAITIAQAGQRVILVDADFRKPMQHNIFEVSADIGLANVLADNTSLQEAIKPTETPGLDVLPCGPIPPNPSEMLNSQAFLDIVRKLSGTYDYVVIDSPPVMPVTDARILGAMCNVTLLVLRADKSTRKAAEQARDGLLSVGAQILGVVVNDVPSRRGRYGNYGYYSAYGYHYGGYGYGRQRGKGTAGEGSEEKTASAA